MRRHRQDEAARPTNIAQTFFVLDADTNQPVCFTTGTSSRTATAAAGELRGLRRRHPRHQTGQTLVLADAEHFTVELFDKVKTQTNFDLLVPMPISPASARNSANCPPRRSSGVRRVSQRRSCLIPPRTARRDHSINTLSGRASGPRSTTTRHSSRPRTATRSRG